MAGGIGVVDRVREARTGAWRCAHCDVRAARAETVGKQHGEASGLQTLAPFLIALFDRRFVIARIGHQAVAGMQRHHCRERARAARAVQYCPQFRIAGRNLDRLGGGRHPTPE